MEMEESKNFASLVESVNNNTNKFNILGIGSSLRNNSSSTIVLEKLLQESKRYNFVDTNLLDFRIIQLPLFDPNKSKKNLTKEIEQVNKLVLNADAYVLASPDYHGSMSGVMKNFLDYYWHEFSGKIFGYIVASHENGLTVIDQMRTAVRQCYGWSMPYSISLNKENDLDHSGYIINKKLQKRIEMMARDMVTYGKLIRMQCLLDINNNEYNTFAAYIK
ncbi:MAG: NADPH-dependent FMN reductase [Nitrososphaeraceae archaeon]